MLYTPLRSEGVEHGLAWVFRNDFDHTVAVEGDAANGVDVGLTKGKICSFHFCNTSML